MRVSQSRTASPRSSQTMGGAGRAFGAQGMARSLRRDASRGFRTEPRRKLIRMLALTTFCVAMLTGCGSTSEPKPVPESTDAKDTASAAEETYTSYIRATNELDLTDPDSAEPAYQWLAGAALATEREAVTTAHAQSLSRDGESLVTLFELREADGSDPILADACVDVSDVTVVNSAGESVVAPDRAKFQSVRVTLEPTKSTQTGLAITDLDGRNDGPTCE